MSCPWTDVVLVDRPSGFSVLTVPVCSGLCPHHGPSGGGERRPAGLLLSVQTGAARLRYHTLARRCTRVHGPRLTALCPMPSGYFNDDIFCHFCASMISGLVTTAASMPVDIVKTR